MVVSLNIYLIPVINLRIIHPFNDHFLATICDTTLLLIQYHRGRLR
nr:MAG TPA: hypothetical protein [Caudoviricetes sp.]